MDMGEGEEVTVCVGGEVVVGVGVEIDVGLGAGVDVAIGVEVGDGVGAGFEIGALKFGMINAFGGSLEGNTVTVI